MRPEWEEGLEPSIAAAIKWLATPQRKREAMTSQFGFTNHIGHNASLMVVAEPENHELARRVRSQVNETPDALIVFQIPEYMPEDKHLPWDEMRRYPRLTQEECDEVVRLIEKHGGRLVHRWNGAGCTSGSFAFQAKTLPSVKALYERYSKGCPKPGHSVFCGTTPHGVRVRDPEGGRDTLKPREEWTPEQIEYADCDWRAGHGRAAPPTWPSIGRPEFAPPGPSEDNRNLLAVKKALEEIHRVCGDMGIVPQTVVAGKRGQINGEEPIELEFEHGSGFGVTFSAEGALRLMHAALAAYESGVLDDRR